MKKKLLLMLIVAGVLFYGCKKGSNNATGVTNSHWTFNSVTYNADTTYFSYTHFILVSKDSADNVCYIMFPDRPAKNGTYTAIYQNAIDPQTVPDSGQCTLLAGNGSNNDFTDTYGSTQTNGKVSVTIIANGKLRVDFSNEKVVNINSDTTLLSGTLVEQ